MKDIQKVLWNLQRNLKWLLEPGNFQIFLFDKQQLLRKLITYKDMQEGKYLKGVARLYISQSSMVKISERIIIIKDTLEIVQ